MLYFVFTYYRNRLGTPPQVEERLGAIISEQRYLPTILEETKGDTAEFKKLIVPLDGSAVAEQVLATARSFARSYDAEIKIIAVDNKNDDAEKQTNLDEYLEMVSGLIQADGLTANCQVRTGKPSEEIAKFAREENADLIVMSTRGKFEVGQLLSGSVDAESSRTNFDTGTFDSPDRKLAQPPFKIQTGFSRARRFGSRRTGLAVYPFIRR